MNKIYKKDVLVGLKSIENHSQDIVLIDPPYNIGKKFHSKKFSMDMDKYSNWIVEIINIALMKIKSGGIIYLYGFPEIVAHFSHKFPINKQRWLVWHYKNKITPSLKMFQRSHETILALWNERPNFNRDNVRVAYSESFIKNSVGKKRSSSKSRFNNKKNFNMHYKAHPQGALPRDVIEFPTLAGGSGIKERIVFNKVKEKFILNSEIDNYDDNEIIKHPTQKPISLTKYLYMSMYHDNKLNICIPFSGTGVESFVAKEMGFRSIAFDINADYVKMGNKLLEDWNFKI